MFRIKNLPVYSSLIIWTFQIFGAVGILFWNSQWFIKMTPMCLILYFLLLNINNKKHSIFFLFMTFFWGFLSEIVGVHTGLIYGSYSYGNSLGIKILNVPLIIGVNWIITTAICGTIASKLRVRSHFKILIAILLMIFLDLFIEPVAPKIDMWSFSDYESAPLSNYITWAIVSLPLQFYFIIKKLEFNFTLAVNLYISQLFFFMVLSFTL